MLIGKSLNILPNEIESFLKKQGVGFTLEFEPNKEIAFVIVSSLLKPYEEEILNELYTLKIPEVSLEEFEEYYISKLKPNSLLMSLKLSSNQDRIKRLLNIKSLNSELYLKIFKLYNWQDEGIFDNNSNRDVAISFIKRFFKPTAPIYNHTDITYSPANLIDIALTSANKDALDAMLFMPSFSFNTRAKEPWKPKELKEFIALNPNLSINTKKTLLALNSKRIDTLLALNPSLNKEEQFIIYNRGSLEALINLAKNENLVDELFKELLNSDINIIKTLLLNQKIDKNRLDLIKKEHLLYLSKNPNIKDIVQDILFLDKKLDFALSSNEAVSSALIKKLYNKYKNEIALFLSLNKNTPKELLEEFFKLNQKEITLNLATNPNTPQDILDSLCELNDYELNKKLALNPSIKDEYLEFFKLDNELLRLMSTNEQMVDRIKKSKEYI